ncbi:G-protein coupled receptors family 1 profile domain-containing protein [Plasmodiophora brassicae]
MADAVQGLALAIGIGGSLLAISSFLVAVCATATIIQGGKITLMTGSILSTSSSACIAAICVAVQWLYPWASSQAHLCDVVAGGLLSFFYCATIGSVLQFLYCRALLVDEHARSTLLMRVIQSGIISVVPFAVFTAAVSRGHVDEHYGVCVPYYPVYVVIMFVLAAFTFSVLLIYKFTTSLREHQARMAKSDESSGAGQARNERLETIAHRNLTFSTIALMATTSTMMYLLINDIVFGSFDTLHMAIENLMGVIDVTINLAVVCTCSTAWIPRALYEQTALTKATTVDVKPKLRPATVFVNRSALQLT